MTSWQLDPRLRGGDVRAARSVSLDDPCEFPEGLHSIDSPAFVYDETVIQYLLSLGDTLRRDAGCRLLFAIKSFSFIDALKLMAPRLDGFAVSSPFEARLARSAAAGGSIHITTPGMRPDEIDEIADVCDYISFNSLTHWDMYKDRVAGRAGCGIRVNPQLSFADDRRYDPCRPHSKLGVPLADLAPAFKEAPQRFSGLQGILFHSNCDSTDFSELLSTVRRVCAQAAPVLSGLEWVNLGGGYLFEEASNYGDLIKAVDLLKSKADVEVFFEPGSALVRSAGYIVSTVLDVFPSGEANIAVLDTTVNHMPEVFEYGFQPDVVGDCDDGPHEYLLAGATCLAGDIFGSYGFDHSLQVGDKVLFNNAGSYTLTKAHVFNGVGLPSVYSLTAQGELVLKSRYTFDQYAARWGAGPFATS